VKAVCTDCGAEGYEETNDLMPNTCPRCFERRIAPVFTKAANVDELFAGLVEAGCHPDRLVLVLGDMASGRS
jgi:DNA-directed RNA polymerase subunit RPC12/RpoP